MHCSLLLLLLGAATESCTGASSTTRVVTSFGLTRSLPANNPRELHSILENSSTLQGVTLLAAHNFRGGAVSLEEDSDDESDDDELDEEDDDGFQSYVDKGEDDGFEEETIVQRFVQAYVKTPPLTKAYLTASVVVTTLGFITGKKDFPPILTLDWGKALSRFQIWRPLTAFLNFGPLGLGYAMTLNFLWVYMGTLERLSHNAPYDFWIMIGFGMLSMVVGYPIMRLNARFLGHNLSTFLVYIWSRYYEGVQVSMFDLFMTRAELLPWFFLLQVRRTFRSLFILA
jgi:Derlin-2/3